MRLRVFLSLLLLLVVSTALNAQVAFSKRSYQAIGQRPIVTDINGDGYPDVIALGGPNGFDNNLHLMLNHRDGTFESPAIDMSTDLLTFAIADLNRDGRPDFLGCFMDYQDGSRNHVLVSAGVPTFYFGEPMQVMDLPGDCFSAVSPDLNGDGNPDIVALFQQRNPDGTWNFGLAVSLGNGSGEFPSLVISPLAAPPDSHCWGMLYGPIITGDYDRDGKVDLLVPSDCSGDITEGALHFLKGDGTGGFTASEALSTSGDFGWLVKDDVNQDGWLDLTSPGTFLGPYSSAGWWLQFLVNRRAAGTPQFDTPGYFSYSCGPCDDYSNGYLSDGLAADLNGDGFKDVVASGSDTLHGSTSYPYEPITYSPYLGYMLGSADGTYGAPAKIPAANGTVVTGDFDRDGRIDVLVTSGYSTANMTMTVFLNRTASAPTCSADPVVRSVRACAPAQLTGNSLHLLANTTDSAPVTGMKVYVDNTMKFYSPNDLLNKWLTVPNGGHRLTVRAWDARGSFSSARWINVNTSFGCSALSTNRSINLCFPTSSSTVGSPTQVVAAVRTSYAYYGAKVYVDGLLKYSTTGKQVNANLALPVGSHKISVQAKDSQGTITKTITASVR